MWLFLLLLVVTGFFGFAVDVVVGVFGLLTTLCVACLVLVLMMNGWARASCMFGDETSCLRINIVNYTVADMTPDQTARREHDYDEHPTADRNLVDRRWVLLRFEKIGGTVYTTRQDCVGPLWPRPGSYGTLDAFETGCFDRQIVSAGPRYGDYLKPAESFSDLEVPGYGLRRSYGSTQVYIQELAMRWQVAKDMFDVSPAGEQPTM